MILIIYFAVLLNVTLSSITSDVLGAPLTSYCFKRTAGERLVAYVVTRIVERSSIKGCEQECHIYKCTHFSFGFLSSRNGTCELTTDRQISRRHDPNFDLYERTKECFDGKPTGYAHACYRRIVSGKRLHEKFIRHSLPCNSLEACQHQCSIEKYFDCQGFNLRLDPARVGRGICELSSVATARLDLNRDFVFDPEFSYYERVYGNDSPNCGYFNRYPNAPPYDGAGGNAVQPNTGVVGGPYYGGDSYGPWSTGYGTVNHGPWGSHGYGSGYYLSNNPVRGPVPSFRPSTPFRDDSYGYGGRTNFPNYEGTEPIYFDGGQNRPFERYPYGGNRRYDRPSRFPTYIIIDADVNRDGSENNQNNLQPFKPNLSYLPITTPQPQNYPQKPSNTPYGTPNPTPESRNTPSGSPTTPANSQTTPQIPQNVTPEPKNTPEAKNTPSGPQSRHENIPLEPPDLSSGSRHFHNEPRYHPRPSIPVVNPDGLQNLPSQPDHYPGHHDYPSHPQYMPSGTPSFSPSFTPHRPHLPPDSFYDTPSHHSYGPFDKLNGVPHPIEHEVCFQRAHPGYRLNPASIRREYDAPTILECEAMCTGSSFKCTGYSFRYSEPGNNVPNCLLTDFASLTPETHLLPDRSCDVYFKMGTCLDFSRMGDAECFLKVSSNRKINIGKTIKRVSVGNLADCELACLNSGFFTCRSFSFRHGSGVIGEPLENCFLSDWPIAALTAQDFVHSLGHEIYERGSYGHGCELDVGSDYIGPGPPFSGYPLVDSMPLARGTWSIDETWRHFTVSGWPCRIGSECQLNSVGGFWYCEVEGGDKSQWDYCCRPKHSCGYSRGFNYPWCYVGEARPDQWRPCSEHYYPDFGNRFSYKPVQNHNSHPANSYGSLRDTRPWNFGEDYGPPTHWPISYLYTDPPPNETDIWDDIGHQNHEYHHHDHHHYYDGDSLLEHHLKHDDENPTIKFKSCRNKIPYPKAVVQKLDNKNNPASPSTSDSAEDARTDKSKQLKKLESLKKVPDSEVILGFSSKSPIRENLSDNDVLPTQQSLHINATEDYFSGKRDLKENSKTKKSKEVIKTVEKIIEQSSTERNSEAEADAKKNQTLKNPVTEYPEPATPGESEKDNFTTLPQIEDVVPF